MGFEGRLWKIFAFQVYLMDDRFSMDLSKQPDRFSRANEE